MSIQKESLTPFLILVLFLGAVFFLVPKIKEVQGLQQDIKGLQKEIQTKQSSATELVQLESKLKPYKKGLDNIETAIPQETFAPRLFIYFERFVPKSGLLLKNINISASSKPQSSEENGDHLGLMSTPISLQLLGSYSALQNFLHQLEYSSRLFNVVHISVASTQESKGEQEDKGLLSFGVQLQVYSQK